MSFFDQTGFAADTQLRGLNRPVTPRIEGAATTPNEPKGRALRLSQTKWRCGANQMARYTYGRRFCRKNRRKALDKHPA